MASKHTKKLLTLVSILAIVGYVIAIERIYGIGYLFNTWKNIGFGVFFMAIALIFITHLVRGFRIFLYFKNTNDPSQSQLSFVPLFYLSQTHNLLNNLLPFRSGEVSFPLLMNSQFNTPIIHASAGLLWLRFLDAHTLGMLALTVIGFKMQLPLWLILGLCTLALSLPIWVFLLKPVLYNKISNNHTQPEAQNQTKTKHWQNKLQQILLKLLDGLPQNTQGFLQSWSLTWLNWLIKIVLMGIILMFLLTQSSSIINLNSHLLAGLSGAVAGEITSVLPINAPAGVGTYAGGVFAGIKWANTSLLANKDIMLAGVQLHLLILLASIIGVILTGAMYLINNKFKSKKTTQ